jgi:malate synthase
LVEIPKGTVTEEGIRKNINVGILYTKLGYEARRGSL